ncbi:MAG: FtsW/RodA/SpoVE family cell cycle protein [Phycisphaerales bacterium]|nr:FtsW/RodA/SpoVE family cell cycle protein [Phycisphaerales bacterium]
MPQRSHLPIFSLHAGWLVVFAAALLTWLGIETIETTRPATSSRQLILAMVGVFAAYCVLFIPVNRMRQASPWFFGFGLVLLVVLIIPGVPDFLVHPRNGARRWINVVVMDMQPSELVKIGFVLALASYLRFKQHYREMKGLLIVLAIAIPPMLLIVVEPDLGTAMLFLPALIAMLVAAGAKFKHLVIIACIGITASLAMYPLLRPHQKDRIQALIAQIEGDDRFEQSIGYQGARAMTLIGAGGMAGVSKDKAAELLKANHLPEEHNDMIFAVICLRFGLVGAIGMWSLYLMLAAGGLIAAVACRDPFPRLVSVGLTAMILGQMVINTAMTLGIAPITGLTLPFVSAGGSSLVVTWCMAGILFNIARHRDPMMTREGFMFS